MFSSGSLSHSVELFFLRQNRPVSMYELYSITLNRKTCKP